jgi:hypothetical protein
VFEVFGDDRYDARYVSRAHRARRFANDGRLCVLLEDHHDLTVRQLNMDMRRLVLVPDIDLKSHRAVSKYCRHRYDTKTLGFLQ